MDSSGRLFWGLALATLSPDNHETAEKNKAVGRRSDSHSLGSNNPRASIGVAIIVDKSPWHSKPPRFWGAGVLSVIAFTPMTPRLPCFYLYICVPQTDVSRTPATSKADHVTSTTCAPRFQRVFGTANLAVPWLGEPVLFPVNRSLANPLLELL